MDSYLDFRGALSHLSRGMENIIIDMQEDPRFVHALMRLTTEARQNGQSNVRSS